MRGKANANFFKQAGGNDLGGGDIIIAAPNRNPNIDYSAQANNRMAAAQAQGAGSVQSGTPASGKAIEQAMKRA